MSSVGGIGQEILPVYKTQCESSPRHLDIIEGEPLARAENHIQTGIRREVEW